VKQKPAALVAALALSSSMSAGAHHSVPAYFDVSKTMTLQGTIKEFKFQNPHSIMTILVVDNGAVQEWKAEASLAAWLLRNGWSPEMFSPGTKVTLTGNPARDDSAKMIRLFTVTLPDGRKLNANNGQQAY
jgi:Family of unknown function (DUF6152)